MIIHKSKRFARLEIFLTDDETIKLTRLLNQASEDLRESKRVSMRNFVHSFRARIKHAKKKSKP